MPSKGNRKYWPTSWQIPLGPPRSVKVPHRPGKSKAGAGPNTPMQVSSSGTTALHSFVMFVVDASQPFSRPAKLP